MAIRTAIRLWRFEWRAGQKHGHHHFDAWFPEHRPVCQQWRLGGVLFHKAVRRHALGSMGARGAEPPAATAADLHGSDHDDLSGHGLYAGLLPRLVDDSAVERRVGTPGLAGS